jgi:hypothetical protein
MRAKNGPKTMLIGYARVSTVGQNLESQIEHLQAAGCDKIFQEKLTGFDRRLPQLKNAHIPPSWRYPHHHQLGPTGQIHP